jgi:hypothetical protein
MGKRLDGIFSNFSKTGLWIYNQLGNRGVHKASPITSLDIGGFKMIDLIILLTIAVCFGLVILFINWCSRQLE